MADRKNVQLQITSPSTQRRTSNFHGISFDEINLLSVSRGKTDGGESARKSPKFGRAQSFGDKLLAVSSPKFAKPKKFFQANSARETQSAVVDAVYSKAARRCSSSVMSTGSSDGSVEAAINLTAYCGEMLEFKRHQRTRLRNRSISVCVEKWNEPVGTKR